MVGGAVGVVGLKDIAAGVVAAGVLHGNRLIGVDVPGLRSLRVDVLVGQDVVEGADAAGELVGGDGLPLRLRVELLNRDGVASVAEDGDGVFLGVSVQVTHDEGGLLLPLRLLGQTIEDSLGVGIAHVGVITLAVAGVLVALGHRTLGLEMVGDNNEGIRALSSALVLHRHELGSERGAGGALETLVLQQGGLTYWLDAVLLVDDRSADDIRVRRGVCRGLDVIPHLGTCARVELAHEVLHGVIVGTAHGIGGVLNLRQADDIGVESLQRGEDLALLVFKCGGRPRATEGTAVGANAVAKAVLIGLRTVVLT